MPEVKDSPAIRADNYKFLQDHIRKQSGIVLDDTKHYLVEARLLPIALDQGLRNLDDLCAKLRQGPPPLLQRRVVEAMTTNETYFFREPAHFEALKNTILPPLIAARRDVKKLSIWSAAASTGQEAYSLGILMLQHFPLLTGWNIRIEGTDICAEVVERAQAGRYHRIEMNRGLPARFIVSCFEHEGEDWVVRSPLKQMCRFRQANLCGPQFPFTSAEGRFDVIFLRNVMLYFSQETRRTLLARIHHVLAPDGILFLGSSEQPADPSIWTSTLAGGTSYFKPKAML